MNSIVAMVMPIGKILVGLRKCTWRSCSALSLVIEGDGDVGRGKDPFRLTRSEFIELSPPELSVPIDPPSAIPIFGEIDLQINLANGKHQ